VTGGRQTGVLLALTLLVTGCGLKGDLYLVEPAATMLADDVPAAAGSTELAPAAEVEVEVETETETETETEQTATDQVDEAA
jgi:predicted small lipoprotein YifL